MPPKLTSKNIFDVVFEQLPADCFIDTGPSSLKEELMLEAAGMLGSAGKGATSQRDMHRGGTNAANNGSNCNGFLGYRRDLLSSASVAATAAMARSMSRSARAAPEASAATAAPGHRVHLAEDDVLDGDALGDDTSSPLSGEAPPPSYTSALGPSAGAASASLVRGVDDEVDISGTDNLACGYRGNRHRAGEERDGDGDAAEVEGVFEMQMDAEDNAVREATKYAGFVAEMQAAEEARVGTQGAASQQLVGGVASDQHNAQAGVRAKRAMSEIGTGVGGSGSRVLGRGDAAGAEGVAASKSTRPTDESSLTAATSASVAVGASSTAVSGAANPRIKGDVGDRVSLAHSVARSQTGSVGTAVPDIEHVAAGGLLAQQPFGFGGLPQRGGVLTAAEQLARMPPGLDHVYTGACVMYRHPKNFGFISPDIGGPDVYFVSDSITLSFTKLALRSFYLRNGMAVPPSVAAAYRMGMPREGTAGPGDDKAPISGASGSAVEVLTNAEAGGLQSAQVSSPNPAVTESSAGVCLEGQGQMEKSGGLPAQSGVLGAFPGLTALAEGMGDRVSIPPTTSDELSWAEKAASLLTSTTARLLQYQVDQGIGGGIRVGDRVSFVVTRNHAGRGGGGRLLRAEFVRGVPAVEMAMPLEQSWFYPLFPGVVGRKTYTPYDVQSMHASSSFPGSSSGDGGVAPLPPSTSSAASLPPASPVLIRYTGCVRTYDAEEQRGYIRCDESGGDSGSNTPDVIFHTHSVLWDLARCPSSKRHVKESLRLAYSVCGTERNGKYIATLITNPHGEPLCEENMTFADHVQPFFATDAGGAGRRRGRGEEGGGVMSGHAAMSTGSGAGPSTDGAGGDKKRAKAAEDDMLLLYAEDDYPFM